MFYILNYAYNPNTAVSNRLLGYYAALDKMGVKTSIVYLVPNARRDKIEIQYKNLHICYLWDQGNYTNKFLRYIYTSINFSRFKKKLKKGDIIYTYGISPFTKGLLKIKGIKIFAERTEHVSIVAGGRMSSLSPNNIIEVAQKLDGLFVISEPLKNLFIDYGVSSDKIEIINMIVDPQRFNGIHKINVSERYIAYCGTVSNNKDGVDQLLRSFAIVVKKFPDVKLYIIGEAPLEKDRSGNLELIQSLNISNNVVFTGIISAKEMPQLLKNAEVLALDRPDSLQAQCGFPTKLGEYLLTENPVVVTKVGDIPKFLTDGVSALLSDERNPEEFANKIEWALTHKDKAAEIGKRGAKVAIENFNCEIETKKLIEFIKKS